MYPKHSTISADIPTVAQIQLATTLHVSVQVMAWAFRRLAIQRGFNPVAASGFNPSVTNEIQPVLTIHGMDVWSLPPAPDPIKHNSSGEGKGTFCYHTKVWPGHYPDDMEPCTNCGKVIQGHNGFLASLAGKLRETPGTTYEAAAMQLRLYADNVCVPTGYTEFKTDSGQGWREILDSIWKYPTQAEKSKKKLAEINATINWSELKEVGGKKIAEPDAADADAWFENVIKQNANEPANDTGNAARFVRLFGKRFAYHPAGDWYEWNGNVWVHDEGERAVTEAAKLVAGCVKEEAPILAGWGLDEDAQNARLRWATTSGNENKLRNMLKLAQGPLLVKDWDADTWLLNFNNGTLDLKLGGGGLRSHQAEDHITKLIPYDFDAHATDEQWAAFKEEVPNDVPFLLRYLGYALTGETREEVALMLHGKGDSGKTTISEAAVAAMGPYATGDLDFSTFLRGDTTAPRPDLVRLAGVRLAFCDEKVGNALGSKHVAENIFKKLISGAAISPRQLHKANFTLKPQAKLLFALNDRPKFATGDTGIWRRVKFYCMEPVKTKKQLADYDEQHGGVTLKKHLNENVGAKQAVMADLYRGCLEWQKDGLQIPESVDEDTNRYEASQDGTEGFIDNCLERAPQEEFVSTLVLRDLCKTYLHEQGTDVSDGRWFNNFWINRVTPALQPQLGALAGRHGKKRDRVWYGVRIVPEMNAWYEGQPLPALAASMYAA